MAHYNITLESEDVQGLFTNDEAVKGLLEKVANQILQEQAAEQAGAEWYERTDSRKAYRAGYRNRMVNARCGRLDLRVPRLRNGRFDTEMFGRLQRSEQALLLALVEMVVNGVSTRKVSRIVEVMCGIEFPRSTVSDLCGKLDGIVTAWNERELDEHLYPFLVLDALYIRIRENGRVRSYAVLLGIGVREDGKREILGLQLSHAETEISWEDFLEWLRDRGLRGVDLVVSDNHRGLVAAIRRKLPGSSWQHCQTHLMRNILDSCPKRLRSELRDRLRMVFHAPDEKTARTLASDVISRYEDDAPDAVDKLEEHLDDALAVMALPQKYRKRLRTSNMIERLNQEIRRRERAKRIFPNRESAMRLIGALLVEQDEAWTEGRKYLDMTEYREWMEKLKSSDEPSQAEQPAEKATVFAH